MDSSASSESNSSVEDLSTSFEKLKASEASVTQTTRPQLRNPLASKVSPHLNSHDKKDCPQQSCLVDKNLQKKRTSDHSTK